MQGVLLPQEQVQACDPLLVVHLEAWLNKPLINHNSHSNLHQKIQWKI